MDTPTKVISLVSGVVVIAAWLHIRRKAGYETRDVMLMGLGMMVPVINLGVLAYFVLAEWPIQHEVRLRRDPRSATEQDALDLYSEASRLETAGKIHAALAKYEQAITICPGTTTARDAEISRQRFKALTAS